MTGLGAHDPKASLWKKLWLAAALGAFGGMSLVSSVSAQDEEYPPPPIKINEPEDIDKALGQVIEHLKMESEKQEVGEQIIEFVRVVTRPKEPADEELSIGYSFSAVAPPRVANSRCAMVSPILASICLSRIKVVIN